MKVQRVQTFDSNGTREYPILYWSESLPNHWVAFGSDKTWYLVPAIPDGWAKRTAYHGNLEALQPAERWTEAAALSLLGGECDIYHLLTSVWISTPEGMPSVAVE